MAKYICICIKLRFVCALVQTTPNFDCTRFKQIYERKHPQQNSCLSVCINVCMCDFGEKLLTIHVKTAEGIIMKLHI